MLPELAHFVMSFQPQRPPPLITYIDTISQAYMKQQIYSSSKFPCRRFRFVKTLFKLIRELPDPIRCSGPCLFRDGQLNHVEELICLSKLVP